MNNFIRELRERGVIRVAGLYGAVVWLLLQASDVLFPAFDIPDANVRYLLFGALGFFPVVIVLAWFYEITDRGIQLEADVRKTGATRLWTGNQIYFVIIGLLLAALLFSIYLNITESGVDEAEEQQFVNVLIADFANKTGDPLFDGSVEEALLIGIEGASFISAFNRNKAFSIADGLNAGDGLDDERARLVAIREGIGFVLSGTISLDEDQYLLTLRAVDPRNGEVVAEVESTAQDKLGVLQAVASLATQLRTEFGDADINEERLIAAETFSTGSLKAMQLYADAQRQAQQSNHESAMKLYEQATRADENFGRAYSGWALSAYQLGHDDEATKLWKRTLPLLDGMTAREKYRTLGLYYSRVSRNYAKAIENYEQLVREFPADEVGRNNLAVSYFLQRDFTQALRVGGDAATLYSTDKTVQSNFVLYAMYAGDFQTAQEVSERLIAEQEVGYKVYIPLAIAQLNSGDIDAAVKAYEDMSKMGSAAASVSVGGLADVAFTTGDMDRALSLLKSGIEKDRASNSGYFLATKYILMAEVYLAQEEVAEALSAIEMAHEASVALGPTVAVALLFVKSGEVNKAQQIADELKKRFQAEQRAYADLIEASIALRQGDAIAAVDKLQASISKTDTWLARLELGKAYMQADANAEALSELELCLDRIGEATAVFLDDVPSYYRILEARAKLEQARQSLGM